MQRRTGQSACRTAAFTLIELLVVIAIIALLVSILLPSIAGAKQLMLKLKCQTNISAITKALVMYEEDYRVLPQRFNPADPDENWGYDDDLLESDFIDNRETFICPTHQNHGYDRPQKAQPSYGFNWYYDNVSIDRVRNTADTIAIAETAGDDGSGSHRADCLNEKPHLLEPARHKDKSNYGYFSTRVSEETFSDIMGQGLLYWGEDQMLHDERSYWPIK